MIRRDRNFQIFNLSFLDVISCGFGAVVLLVLISKTGVTKLDNTSDVSSLLQNVFQYEETVEKLASVLEDQKARLKAIKEKNSISLSEKEKISREKRGKTDNLENLKEDTRGLELVQSTLRTASISKATAKIRDVEVGGIPVDSDYIIFIVDTSGSMLTIWNQVIRRIGDVLDVHPTVKGFQILNDNGAYLYCGRSGIEYRRRSCRTARPGICRLLRGGRLQLCPPELSFQPGILDRTAAWRCSRFYFRDTAWISGVAFTGGLPGHRDPGVRGNHKAHPGKLERFFVRPQRDRKYPAARFLRYPSADSAGHHLHLFPDDRPDPFYHICGYAPERFKNRAGLDRTAGRRSGLSGHGDR